MNPLETLVSCPHDGTRMEWLWSKPQTKAENAVYDNEYGCSHCGYRVVIYSFGVKWSDAQQALDFGPLG